MKANIKVITCNNIVLTETELDLTIRNDAEDLIELLKESIELDRTVEIN